MNWRQTRNRAAATAAAGLVLGACLLQGCERETKVVRYKPFLANAASWEYQGPQAVNPNEGYADPTQTGDDKSLIEHPDGSKTLISKSVRQMMAHLERTLDEGEDDLLIEQVISEKTRAQFAAEGKGPKEIIAFLRKNREHIAKLFGRMPLAEHSPTVILDQPGDRMWVIRVTGAPARDLKFKRLWARYEGGNWRFVWVN